MVASEGFSFLLSRAETQEAWKLRKSQQDRWTEEGEREDEANEKEDTTEEAAA